ncbi:hypothetical protein ACFL4G_08475 [Thermodesulfobacteriota bacterium]
MMKKILLFLCLTSILPFAAGLGSAVAEEEVEGNPAVHLYLVKNYELIRTLTEGFLKEYRAYGEEDAYESITLALLKEFMIDVVRDIDLTTYAGDLTAEDRKIKAYCHFMLGIVLDRIKNYYRAHFEYHYANEFYPFARIETIDIGGESINFYTEIRRFKARTRNSENLGTIKFRIRDFQFFSPLKPGVILLDKTTRLPVDPRIIEVVDNRIAMGDTEFETLIPFGIYTIDHKDKDVYIKDFYLIQGMDTAEVILAPNFWFSLKLDPVIPNMKLYSEGIRYWDISYLRYGKYNIMINSEEYFIKNELNEFVLPTSLSANKDQVDSSHAYDQHYPEVGQTYVIKLREKGSFYKKKQNEERKKDRSSEKSKSGGGGFFKPVGDVFRSIGGAFKKLFTS